MFKFRELLAAGAFVQRSPTTPSSFSGVNVESASNFNGPATVGHNLIGNARIRGLATMNSGTTVVSIAATGVVSGDVIFGQPLQYGDARTAVASGSQFFIGVVACSVRAGAFELFAIGSRAPISDMPLGWFKIA